MERAHNRVDGLVAAAARVFRTRGYRRTHMADVALEFGVTPGALYRYVESKEALFHIVVCRAFQPDPPPFRESLPIRTPAPGATLKRLRERLETGLAFPRLESALARRAPDAREELEGIVREIYTQFAATREAADLVERSALDLPELAKLWFGEVRRKFFERMSLYVARRSSRGDFRPTPNPELTAQLVVEAIVFFARHRHRHGDVSPQIDDETAQQIVIAFILHGLLPDAANA